MSSTGSVPSPGRCPDCGGRLAGPVSGDVHCFVECEDCGTRFDLKDARIELPSGGSLST